MAAPSSFAFAKYEGTGNDFVVLEGETALAFEDSRAPALCDRHFGIGADGVLLVLPPVTPGAVGRMRVINADGSEPEMCGNGLRCMALAVLASQGRPEGDLMLDTGAGPKPCVVRRQGGGAQVTIGMGVVRYVASRPLDLPGETHVAHLVDAGNPHAILFDEISASERARLGPLLERHAAFPHRTNVEFASMGEAGIELQVWERGVGFTLACGTGACATAVAAWYTGQLAGTSVHVRLPGGLLHIERLEGGEVAMTGPARHVYSGLWSHS